MTEKHSPDLLREALGKFVGRPCAGFVIGVSTGSVINLEFEPRRPRKVPVGNPGLTDEQRAGEAEYSLFVGCTWRLDSDDAIICGAWDNSSADGLKARGLQELVGKKVVSWVLSVPGLDLGVKFENGWTFRIFCDQVNELDKYDNYSVFLPAEILVVGTRSTLLIEEVSPD